MSAADISATDILRNRDQKVSPHYYALNGHGIHGIHGPPRRPSTLVSPLTLLDAKASQLDPATRKGEEGRAELGGMGWVSVDSVANPSQDWPRPAQSEIFQSLNGVQG